jgi:hypothetical protein
MECRDGKKKICFFMYVFRPGKPGLDGLDIPLEPEPSFPCVICPAGLLVFRLNYTFFIGPPGNRGND